MINLLIHSTFTFSQHEGNPYCHVPCYGYLFGPKGVNIGKVGCYVYGENRENEMPSEHWVKHFFYLVQRCFLTSLLSLVLFYSTGRWLLPFKKKKQQFPSYVYVHILTLTLFTNTHTQTPSFCVFLHTPV